MTRRGFAWVGSEHRTTPGGRVPDGPLYVEWESPERDDAPRIVLVHGGGGQGTDWWGTPDGRPGWAPMLVAAGWSVHVVDRPGHGRAAAGCALGRGPAPGLEMTAGLFAPGDPRQHQWPGPGGAEDPAIAQLAASSTGLPLDPAAAQALEGARLGELLERIGPSVVVAHSLGAPAAWLAADTRPDLVRALVVLEPPGPPFLDLPQAGIRLDHGLTTAPMTYDPPAHDLAELRDGTPRTLPSFIGLPVAVVEAEASPLGAGCAAVARFLRDKGAHATHLPLAEHGIAGNGHGMIIERNHGAILDLVLSWLHDVSPDLPHREEPLQIKEHR